MLVHAWFINKGYRISYLCNSYIVKILLKVGYMILYSAIMWRGKILANLANSLPFTNILPPILTYLPLSVLTSKFIFPHQSLEISLFANIFPRRIIVLYGMLVLGILKQLTLKENITSLNFKVQTYVL